MDLEHFLATAFTIEELKALCLRDNALTALVVDVNWKDAPAAVARGVISASERHFGADQSRLRDALLRERPARRREILQIFGEPDEPEAPPKPLPRPNPVLPEPARTSSVLQPLMVALLVTVVVLALLGGISSWFLIEEPTSVEVKAPHAITTASIFVYDEADFPRARRIEALLNAKGLTVRPPEKSRWEGLPASRDQLYVFHERDRRPSEDVREWIVERSLGEFRVVDRSDRKLNVPEGKVEVWLGHPYDPADAIVPEIRDGDGSID
ncbi:MAG: hypothetical protein AAGA48_08405 [Myxococcota bacterium]